MTQRWPASSVTEKARYAFPSTDYLRNLPDVNTLLSLYEPLAYPADYACFRLRLVSLW